MNNEIDVPEYDIEVKFFSLGTELRAYPYICRAVLRKQLISFSFNFYEGWIFSGSPYVSNGLYWILVFGLVLLLVLNPVYFLSFDMLNFVNPKNPWLAAPSLSWDTGADRMAARLVKHVISYLRMSLSWPFPYCGLDL